MQDLPPTTHTAKGFAQQPRGFGPLLQVMGSRKPSNRGIKQPDFFLENGTVGRTANRLGESCVHLCAATLFPPVTSSLFLRPGFGIYPELAFNS